ncbi:methane monooxygenase/ammonia monooxygenase subunit B [Bradyrhizobium sp. USDA 10063]
MLRGECSECCAIILEPCAPSTRYGARDDLGIGMTDVAVALGLTVVVLALVFGGYAWEAESYPYNVPLQSGTSKIAPLPAADPGAVFKVEKATYDVPGRSMRLTASVTNTSDKPLLIGELSTANIRFVNRKLEAEMAQVDKAYPAELVARNDLIVSNNAPLKPGEARQISIEATDAVWETERLVSFLTDVDSKFGGLIFLYDDAGQRHIAEIGGPIVPTFTELGASVAVDEEVSDDPQRRLRVR